MYDAHSLIAKKLIFWDIANQNISLTYYHHYLARCGVLMNIWHYISYCKPLFSSTRQVVSPLAAVGIIYRTALLNI